MYNFWDKRFEGRELFGQNDNNIQVHRKKQWRKCGSKIKIDTENNCDISSTTVD